MMIQFSFLFSGKRSPTHPGRPPEVHDQDLSGHQKLLPGQKSGKNINNFCPNTQVQISKIRNISFIIDK